MQAQPSELKIKVPKEKKVRVKVVKEPMAPKVKKARKNKCVGVFCIKQGLFTVSFD